MESAINTNSAVNQTLRHHIIDVSTNKVWVDEDVIVATADYLQRQIYIFVAASSASPLVYSLTKVLPHCCLIQLAYYEPGHYRAILNVNNAQHSNQPSTITACTLPDPQQPLLVNLSPVDNDAQMMHYSLS